MRSEGQWARRHRERRVQEYQRQHQSQHERESRSPHQGGEKPGVSTIPHPYILFCRAEDDKQAGFWTLAGADSPGESDQLTRAMQRKVGRLTLRCDLVENTDEAITAWASQSVSR